MRVSPRFISNPRRMVRASGARAVQSRLRAMEIHAAWRSRLDAAPTNATTNAHGESIQAMSRTDAGHATTIGALVARLSPSPAVVIRLAAAAYPARFRFNPSALFVGAGKPIARHSPSKAANGCVADFNFFSDTSAHD
ncbi:MAG TPA: hypothetical protein VJS41_10870 [Stellaceae bacterium]|nr:hypothetical protein [Stellaceae bacterium]